MRRLVSVFLAIAVVSTVVVAYMGDQQSATDYQSHSAVNRLVPKGSSSYLTGGAPGPDNKPSGVVSAAKVSGASKDAAQDTLESESQGQDESSGYDIIADIKDHLFQSGDKKITDLDSKVVSYMENAAVSSGKKADALWGLILEVGLNSPAASYFLDVLEVLRPLHLSDQLMSAFNSNADEKIKGQIMQVLAYSTFVDADSELTPEKLDYVASQSEKIRNFVKSNMDNPAGNEEFRQALDAHMLISPTDEVAGTASRMLAGNYEKFLSRKEVVDYIAQVKFSSDSGANIPMSNLLEAAATLPPQESRSFNQTVFQYLKDETATALEQGDRQELMRYLEKQEPVINLSGSNQSDAIELGEYYNWVEAVTVAQATTPEEKNDVMKEKLLQTQDNSKAAIILLFADEQLKNNMDQQQRNDLGARLDGAVLDPQTPEAERLLLQDALAYLRDSG